MKYIIIIFFLFTLVSCVVESDNDETLVETDNDEILIKADVDDIPSSSSIEDFPSSEAYSSSSSIGLDIRDHDRESAPDTIPIVLPEDTLVIVDRDTQPIGDTLGYWIYRDTVGFGTNLVTTFEFAVFYNPDTLLTLCGTQKGSSSTIKATEDYITQGCIHGREMRYTGVVSESNQSGIIISLDNPDNFEIRDYKSYYFGKRHGEHYSYDVEGRENEIYVLLFNMGDLIETLFIVNEGISYDTIYHRINGEVVSLLENTPGRCMDGRDNDGNGIYDCDDNSCAILEICIKLKDSLAIEYELLENTLEKCTDEIDNDNNGKIDMADYGCRDFRKDENVGYRCNDGVDNDGDGFVDCDDPDCDDIFFCEYDDVETTLEFCFDGLDNDADGRRDCGDPSCNVFAFCDDINYEVCKEEVDNGIEDFYKNCCIAFGTCPDSLYYELIYANEIENTFEFCADEIDNDGDGIIDCDDPSCSLQCAYGYDLENTLELCTDEIDNEGDGRTDCNDPSCYEHCTSFLWNTII